MTHITNPILPGFNPDPSIIRVGDDYYIATSTFEWFPGVQIHHSRDLVNWELIAHPLNRVSQIDLKGCVSSGGVWAPCLTYSEGIYYLVYTDVKSVYTNTKDTHNYLVTTTDIRGGWSEPIYLGSHGFDPSLFHDENGRKWLLGIIWDYRKNKNRFGGIIMQEYSLSEEKLIGEVYRIYEQPGDLVEGPHIYQKDGWYYLLLADGGTGVKHSCSMARSKSIFGPYEVDSENPFVTSRFDPTHPLQKAGHGDLVQTQDGQWYMVHLCARPIPSLGRYVLGRETGIQKMVWNEEGWLRTVSGKKTPELLVEGPKLPLYAKKEIPTRDDFNAEELNIHFQSLRIPLDETFYSLTERKGFLRLYGRESLSSKYSQSLIARRQQAFCYTATTCIEFEPEHFKQMAGIVCLYDIENFYYLTITHNEEMGKCIQIMTSQNNNYNEPMASPIAIPSVEKYYLRAEINYDILQFYYSVDEENWIKVGSNLDHSILSDDCCREGWFTGAMIGICCQDLAGTRKYADFDWFEYIEQ